MYVYILHKRRYYTQNRASIRYATHTLQNLYIVTHFHIAILYGKMKIHFCSIPWIILYIHRRKGDPRKNSFQLAQWGGKQITSQHTTSNITLSKPSRCVSIQLVYIFTSYTTINIIIHTIELVALNCVNYNINCCVWRKYIY